MPLTHPVYQRWLAMLRDGDKGPISFSRRVVKAYTLLSSYPLPGRTHTIPYHIPTVLYPYRGRELEIGFIFHLGNTLFKKF